MAMHMMMAQTDVLVPAIKLAAAVILLTPWLAAAPWVWADTRRVDAPTALWTAVVLGAGGAGLLAWMLIPFYVVGLLFFLILAGGGIGAYVAFRNARVAPEHKVLTPAHLGGLLASGGRKRKRDAGEILTKVTIYSHDEEFIFPPDMTEAEDEEIATYNLVQEFLYDLVRRRAGEVGVTPAGEQARVMYLIDGLPTERPAIPLADSERIIQFVKDVAGMDTDDRRRPQTGSMSVNVGEHRTDMSVQTAGTTGGQRMTMRILQHVVRTSLAELNMPDDVLGKVAGIAKTKNGLFIVSGRRGSGATSTLYSMLRERDAFIQNIVTIESKTEVDLENITQHTYGEEPERISGLLTEVMKEGLDVLMIDACPDADAAAKVIKIAAKRPVLLGVRGGDSFTALARWVKISGDPQRAVAVLRAVSCQMLVRRLCEDCREAYTPDPRRLAKLNLGGERIESFYRPPSEPPKDECPTCQGTGYKGQAAVFELLEMTDEIRSLITEGATVAQIRAACRKNKMLYLQEQAMKKVIDGTTSVQEVIRITQQARKK